MGHHNGPPLQVSPATMPTLVHGVDISTLEGWMVKINSNPSLFGKSFSRRWFRVSFVPAGSDQKLIISYSTNKTSKEPRGWLYIEDVSGVYCRRDMIEVVSPARTLRFKGETAVEHRLWSDSLHKLCNPPKPKSAAEIAEEKRLEAERAALHERQREQLRSQDRDRIADPKKTREFADSQRSSADEAKEPTTSRKSPVEMASPRDHAPPSAKRRESAPEQRDPRPRRDRRKSSSDHEREDGRGSSDEGTEDDEPPRRRQSQEPRKEKMPRQHDSPCEKSSPQTSSRRSETTRPNPREDYEAKHNDSDEDDDDDDDDEDAELERRRASQGTLGERRPSLLVASIKSLSPVVATPKATSSKPSDTRTASMPSRESSSPKRDAKTAHYSNEHEDDDDDSPQHESPRDIPARASVSTPAVVAKTKSTDYFDEDDSDEEANNARRPSIPTAQAANGMAKTPPVTQMSEIRADNNFADDDWDAEEPTPAPRGKQRDASPEKRASVGVGFGGVTADSNFATEDWD